MTKEKKTKTPKDKALKSNKITFIVLEVIGIACLAAGYIIGDMVLYAGVLFGGCFVLMGPYVWAKGKKCINNSFCPECGTKYQYETDVEWEVTGQTDDGNKEKAIVEFNCVCRKCNHEAEFTQTFVTAYYDNKKGTWVRHNVKTLARKYFWK